MPAGARARAGETLPLGALVCVTVYCADCKREGVAYGNGPANAAFWLRKQGWHFRGAGVAVCPRCCAHARRPQRGRR